MSVSLVLVVLMAVMYACGVYLMLERSMTRVVLGFLLVGNATNILILIMGGRRGLAPILNDGATSGEINDPLPQAFILTAIVITFGVTAFLLALIYRSWRLSRADELEDDPEDLAIAERDAAVQEELRNPDPLDTEVDHLDELAAAHDLGERGEE
ncbi:MAG: Na(+)/H(+) antiporter subunit [Homoserinimonas sp.]|jgi:multicomponent Na+:H+ antiporter subunit C|nr:Na(+)/H(+) antiporter subunit [Mycetocola sp.]MCU1546397.1 Na(+)/H(+) antiporter subunit [Homoserinimonas sp.]